MTSLLTIAMMNAVFGIDHNITRNVVGSVSLDFLSHSHQSGMVRVLTQSNKAEARGLIMNRKRTSSTLAFSSSSQDYNGDSPLDAGSFHYNSDVKSARNMGIMWCHALLLFLSLPMDVIASADVPSTSVVILPPRARISHTINTSPMAPSYSPCLFTKVKRNMKNRRK